MKSHWPLAVRQTESIVDTMDLSSWPFHGVWRAPCNHLARPSLNAIIGMYEYLCMRIERYRFARHCVYVLPVSWELYAFPSSTSSCPRPAACSRCRTNRLPSPVTRPWCSTDRRAANTSSPRARPSSRNDMKLDPSRIMASLAIQFYPPHASAGSLWLRRSRRREESESLIHY